jgi:hypothetical protein
MLGLYYAVDEVGKLPGLNEVSQQLLIEDGDYLVN